MEKWRCPTCRAFYRGGTQCYRCQCDLSQLQAILEQANELKGCALLFLREGWVDEALEVIQHSLFLHRDTKAEGLEALIYASLGEFHNVLRFLGQS